MDSVKTREEEYTTDLKDSIKTSGEESLSPNVVEEKPSDLAIDEEYVLFGSDEVKNFDQRIAFLTKLFEKADQKGDHITGLRQKNLNLALVIFAAVITYTMGQQSSVYSFAIAVALLCMMIIFALLDRRFHKFVHGWRASRKLIAKKIIKLLNDPSSDIYCYPYLKSAEKDAEKDSLQPLIFYFLILGALGHLTYVVF